MDKNAKFFSILLSAILLATNSCRKNTSTSIPAETPPTEQTEEMSGDCIWNATVSAWIDQNGNGKRDDNDIPLEDVEFQVNDTLNNFEDVSEPAISDGNGKAKLSVWLPGCPDTNFEVYAIPPVGYQVITDKTIEIKDEQVGTAVLSFGFALIDGYPPPTPYIAGLTCKTYSETAVDFTVDSHGTVWLINEVGVKKFQPSSDSWDAIYGRGNIVDGQIFVSQNDIVWVNEGATTTRIENRKSVSYSEVNDPVTQSTPSIGVTPDGFIWFHDEWSSLLFGYNPETSSWKSFLSENGKTPAMPAGIFTDGEVWRATNAEMLALKSYSPEEWDFYPSYIFINIEIIDNPIPGYLSSATIDQQGKIWLATNNGIAQYDSELNSWKVLTTTQLFDHFDKRVITHINASPDGSIWVAIENQHPLLFKLTVNNSNFGNWRKFDFRDGIPDLSNIKTIEFDHDGNLWIGFENQSKIAKCTEIKP